MSIKCTQCGAYNPNKYSKKCPKCGDTYKDEMVHKVRRGLRLKKKNAEHLVIILIILLITCGIAEISNRLYSWEEKKTSPIADKQTHAYTYCCIHDDEGHCTGYCTDIHHVIILEDGHEEEIPKSNYERYDIGQNYTYSITHVDWKPGAKDAPIPPWVFIVPIGVVMAIAVALWSTFITKRKKELREWSETGDTEVEGEDE